MLILILQAIILGIVQGATEFLPISSSAHLILVPWLFGWNDPALNSLPFDVSLHLGTLVAVIIYFAADWLRLLSAGIASIRERRIGSDPDRHLAWALVIATIPGLLIGGLLEPKIEDLFHSPNQPLQTWTVIVIAVGLALLGGLLWLAGRLARQRNSLQNLTFKNALLIGLSQAAAIIPGVSRSGATITTGLALNLTREAAARFSFLLSAPVIAAAGLKSVYDILRGAQAGALAQGGAWLFLAGSITAGITGYLCIRFLLNYLQKNTVSVFAYYRFALAILVIIVALTR